MNNIQYLQIPLDHFDSLELEEMECDLKADGFRAYFKTLRLLTLQEDRQLSLEKLKFISTKIKCNEKVLRKLIENYKLFEISQDKKFFFSIFLNKWLEKLDNLKKMNSEKGLLSALKRNSGSTAVQQRSDFGSTDTATSVQRIDKNRIEEIRIDKIKEEENILDENIKEEIIIDNNIKENNISDLAKKLNQAILQNDQNSVKILTEKIKEIKNIKQPSNLPLETSLQEKPLSNQIEVKSSSISTETNETQDILNFFNYVWNKSYKIIDFEDDLKRNRKLFTLEEIKKAIIISSFHDFYAKIGTFSPKMLFTDDKAGKNKVEVMLNYELKLITDFINTLPTEEQTAFNKFYREDRVNRMKDNKPALLPIVYAVHWRMRNYKNSI